MDEMTVRGTGRNRGLRSLAGVALIAAVALGSADAGWSRASTAAGRPADERHCPEGTVGFLGITLLECRGDCILTLDDGGRDRAWSFSVEPRIRELAAESPAARALRIGDWIVAIDGHLITTGEGGRRFANIAPDQRVTLRYRRMGSVGEASLRAGARCGPAVEGVSALPSSAEPAAPDAASGQDLAWAGPGMLIQRWNTVEGLKTRITLSPADRLSQGAAPGASLGDLGMDFGCGPCSQSIRDGRSMWSFSNPIDVTGVDVGGPADRAGIRVGDRIMGLNGMSIESEQGGEAFSTLRPGQATRLTLVGSGGRERTVTIVPGARSRRPAQGTTPKAARGHLGMSIGCGPCSETFRDGQMVHSFSGPIEVLGVEAGGAADRAGLRAGDRITAIDGLRIETTQGGEAFSRLQPGRATRFTVVGHDGRTRTVTVVPD